MHQYECMYIWIKHVNIKYVWTMDMNGSIMYVCINLFYCGPVYGLLDNMLFRLSLSSAMSPKTINTQYWLTGRKRTAV